VKRRYRYQQFSSEDQIQAAIVSLLRVSGHRDLIWFHCPNGIPCSKETGARFVKLGMKAGVPDLCFVLPYARPAFLEVKTKGGRQSIAQRAFEMKCNFVGVPYAIVRSVTEAQEILSRWGALQERSVERRAA